MISASLPIETPEGVTFTYELASLIDRGKAYLLDLLIRIAFLAAVGLVLLLLLGRAPLAIMGLLLIVAFLLEWGYFVLFEVRWSGQSPGKRACGLRVVKSAGHPIGFYDSALRNLLRAVDMLPLPYSVGALSVLATRRFQRLGDLAADTIVVHERQSGYLEAPPARLLQGQLPSLGDLAGASQEQSRAALGGIVLTNRERRLLQEFVLRQDRLLPERREELAALLAEPYRRRYGLAPQASAAALLEQLYRSSLGKAGA